MSKGSNLLSDLDVCPPLPGLVPEGQSLPSFVYEADAAAPPHMPRCPSAPQLLMDSRHEDYPSILNKAIDIMYETPTSRLRSEGRKQKLDVVIELLRRLKLSQDEKRHGLTLMQIVVRNGHYEVMFFLIKEKKFDVTSECERINLSENAHEKNTCLLGGPHYLTGEEQGGTLAHLAYVHGLFITGDELLKAGVSASAKDVKGRTAGQIRAQQMEKMRKQGEEIATREPLSPEVSVPVPVPSGPISHPNDLQKAERVIAKLEAWRTLA